MTAERRTVVSRRTPMKTVLTVPQAAAALGVTRQRVLQLIKAGELKADRIPAPGGFMYLLPRRVIERESDRRQHGRQRRKEPK